MVRMEGLEPPRLSPLVPKTSVSTISPHPHNMVFKLIALFTKDCKGLIKIFLKNLNLN